MISHQIKVDFIMKNKSLYIGMFISFLTIFGSLEIFESKGWKLSYEQQAYLRCLPIEWSITTEEKITPSEVVRGMLVVVKTDEYEQFYRKGATLLKLIVGIPGDKVNFDSGRITINDQFIAEYRVGEDEEFKPFSSGKFILKDGEYWISGSTRVSLDSRYIGPVSLDQIIGKGYAII